MIIKSKKLSQFENIKHGISTISTGGLVFETNPKSGGFTIGKTRFFHNIDIDEADIFVKSEQKHTGNITCIGHHNLEKNLFGKHASIPENDAIITNVVGVNLVVYTADCVPVLLYDPVEEVIAVVHAGWRGIVKGIVGNTVKAMKKDFGSSPDDIVTYIGPCLCKSHFEVHSDVADKFNILFPHNDDIVLVLDKFDDKGVKFQVDLRKAVEQQLLQQGIDINNIEIDEHCTWEDGNLHSARHAGSAENSNWSFIGMRA